MLVQLKVILDDFVVWFSSLLSGHKMWYADSSASQATLGPSVEVPRTHEPRFVTYVRLAPVRPPVVQAPASLQPRWQDARPLHRLCDQATSLPVEQVDLKEFEHRLCELFPFGTDVTPFERALMLNKMLSQMHQGCFRMARVLKHHGCWRKAMQVEVDMDKIRLNKHAAARESLAGAQWTLEQPCFKEFVQAIPMSLSDGELAWVTRVGRTDFEVLHDQWDVICEQVLLFGELLSLGCDAQPANQLVAVHDFAGANLLSNLTHVSSLIKLTKIGCEGHPGVAKLFVLLNCSKSTAQLFSKVLSSYDPNAPIQMLPFPYDLQRLLQLTSLNTLRAHARCQPETTTINNGDMAEHVYEAGVHAWALQTDGEVAFTVYFVTDQVKELVSKRCRADKGSFRAPGPGLLWLRIVNESGSEVRMGFVVTKK